MADQKISAQTVASTLTGAELVPVVQSSANRRTTTQGIANLVSLTSLGASANGVTLIGHTFAQMRADLDLEIGTDVQAYNANLTTYASIAPSANVQSLLGAADYSAMRTQLGLVIGTNVQAYDADLTTWAGLTPSANAQSFVVAANYAAMRALLDLEAGTDFYSIAATDAAISTAISTHVGLADPHTQYVLESAIGVTVQAYDADLATWAGVTSSANGRSLVSAADYAAMRALLDLEVGTDFYSISAANSAIAAVVSDTAYDATSWNGVTTIAPSKNAVRDKFAALAQADIAGLTTASSPTFTGLSLFATATIAPGAGGIAVSMTAAGTAYNQFYNSSAGADLKYFRYGNASGTLQWERVNDAYSAATTLLTLDGSALGPGVNDSKPLGSATVSWSDLFLASGGVINFNNGNATITHSAGRIASNVPIGLPSYTVAGLPAGSTGDHAYASNGRKNGEGGGAGTGVMVFKDATAWRACDTGATVAA